MGPFTDMSETPFDLLIKKVFMNTTVSSQEGVHNIRRKVSHPEPEIWLNS